MKQPSLLSGNETPYETHRPASPRADHTNGHNNHGTRRRFEKGALIFLEGDTCTGAFFLKSGRIKLSSDRSSAGRCLTVGIAEPGDAVGLAAAIAGTAYEASAEAIEACDTEFIPRADLMGFFSAVPSCVLQAVRQLSNNYLHACDALASLSASDPVIVRLARLFVSWSPPPNGGGCVNIKNGFTHQQIAEMIGTTRETVTRALSELRCRKLATAKNGDLVIHDPARLRMLAGNGAWNNRH